MSPSKLIDEWLKIVRVKTQIQGNDSDANRFYRTVRRAQTVEDDEETRPSARLEFLLRGSPKIRAMGALLRDQVLVGKEKALVWVMFPAEQIIVELMLREMGIDAHFLHSAFGNSKGVWDVFGPQRLGEKMCCEIAREQSQLPEFLHIPYIPVGVVFGPCEKPLLMR